MKNDILASLARLSDAQLVAQLQGLVARERDATAQIVAHLAELDTRDVHLRRVIRRSSSTAGTHWGFQSGRPTTGSRSPGPPAGFR